MMQQSASISMKKMGGRKFSKIILVSESTISSWIRNFTAETKGQVVMKSKSSIKSASSVTKTGDSEVKALQAEIRRLKKELAHESLRDDAFNELINVAEKQFNISIRKKLAPSSKERVSRHLRFRFLMPSGSYRASFAISASNSLQKSSAIQKISVILSLVIIAIIFVTC